jgi:allantoinase
MKSGAFASAWGGIAGVQSTLAVLLERGYHQRALPLERIASLVAATPASRFGLPRKGRLVVGADADMTLMDVASSFQLQEQTLQQRHPQTPYLGHTFRGVVRRTIRRGETIFRDGSVTARSGGRLVRPVTRPAIAG